MTQEKETGCAPEKDVIALVVKGGHLAALEGAVLTEQRRQQPTYPLAHHRVEVVHDHFRLVVRGSCMPLLHHVSIAQVMRELSRSICETLINDSTPGICLGQETIQ